MKGQQPAGKTEHLLKTGRAVIPFSVPKATPVDTARPAGREITTGGGDAGGSDRKNFDSCTAGCAWNRLQDWIPVAAAAAERSGHGAG